MRLNSRAMLLGVVVLIAAGCQTTNQAVYERPLNDANAFKKIDMESEKGEANFPYAVTSLSPSYTPDLKSDEAGLWMSMNKVERNIKNAGNRIADEKLNKYIEDLTCKLAGEYCKDIRVYVVRVPAFNATMSPNGMMQVWTGLLLRVQNEAQLAAVLGHEIGHYLRRHSLQRMRDMIQKSNLATFLGVLSAAAGVPGAGELVALAAYGNMAAFGRDNEREADGFSLLFLGKNGYAPDEAWKVWDRVIKEKEAQKDKKSGSLFAATHPPSKERLNVLKELAPKIEVKGTPIAGKDRFNDVIAPYRLGFLQDELKLRKYDRLEALLDMLIEDGNDLAELHFIKGEMYRLRKEEGDKEKAMESYATALAAGLPPSEIHRSMGLIYRKAGNYGAARKSFGLYLSRNPDAADKLMIEHLLKGMNT